MAKRPKSKAPKQPKRRFEPAEVAAMLIAADRSTIRAVAAENKLAERTLWRWKSQVESGEWREVADLVRELKEASLDRCKDLLAEVYEMALTEMKAKIPTATYKELLETVVETGGLKVFKDSLGESGSNTGSSAGSQAHAGPTAAAPGGAGIQKTLRVVG